MPWVKFDDRFPWHRKIRRLSDAAFRLHVSAIHWCSEHLTDGRIQADDLPFVSDTKRPQVAVKELEKAGLWDVADDGWTIHDYLEYQPSAEKVLEERAKKTARQQRWRDNRSRTTDPAVDASTDATTDASVTPAPYPNPTRTRPAPEEEEKDPLPRKRGQRIPDDFAVTADMVAWARDNCPDVDGRLETAQFVDHWQAATGKGSTKRDWTAAWRTWMRNAQKWTKPKAGNVVALRTPQQRTSTTDARVAAALEAGARVQAQLDQQQRGISG